MSFRLFIYYCTVCGGVAAYLGWILGRAITSGITVDESSEFGNSLVTGLEGLALALLVSFGLAVMDAAWSFSLSPMRILVAILRIAFVSFCGPLAGFIGGFVGQWLFDWKNVALLMVIGWT